MINKVISVIFLFWILISFCRSIQYVIRIGYEASFDNKSKYRKNYCECKTRFADLEEERLYNYYQIGGVCER